MTRSTRQAGHSSPPVCWLIVACPPLPVRSAGPSWRSSPRAAVRRYLARGRDDRQGMAMECRSRVSREPGPEGERLAGLRWSRTHAERRVAVTAPLALQELLVLRGD